MFTGIIKSTGIITSVNHEGSSLRIMVSSPVSDGLHIDQSVSHDGACLTVVETHHDTHTVIAVAETLAKTTFGQMREGHIVNLETAITPATLLDGHIVQGHVDTVIRCLHIEDLDGSRMMRFSLPPEHAALVIPQGSVCINGISLTVARLDDDAFGVSIIPYTWQHTNMQYLRPGDPANVEFDVIGKYVERFSKVFKTAPHLFE